MLVEQRVELGAERSKAAGLHLHQLAVGADDVDHEPADRYLQPVARRGQYRLDRGIPAGPSRSTPMPDTSWRLKAASAAGDPCRTVSRETRTRGAQVAH